MHDIAILDEHDIAGLLTTPQAADAVRDALLAGLDPAMDMPRTVVDVASGQLLLMPSEGAAAVGIKAVTVAPGNTAIGLPRVHGAYLLFDATTLVLQAILDGATVSNIRTAAVSLAGAQPALGRFPRPIAVTVFGAGPQAVFHAEALVTSRSAQVRNVVYVVRHPERARDELGPAAIVLASSDPAVEERLRSSDVVVCATTSQAPLFESALLAPHAVVIAVGAHTLEMRELDGPLLARAMVVVEDVQTVLREGGDIATAVAGGYLSSQDLVPMADVIRGRIAPASDRPYVFKSVGMSWEDLVVAEAVMRQHAARPAS